MDAFRALDSELTALPKIACEQALPLISAVLDGEAAAVDARLAEIHLGSCWSCVATQAAWRQLGESLSSLPSGSPSSRTDAAVARLITRGTSRSARTAVIARTFVAVTATAALFIASLARQAAPVAQFAAPGDQQVIVASIQQVLLNPRTNTLYVLESGSGVLDARDASSNDLKARITVGGQPVALALNEPANTVLVLDSVQRRVTEIDSVSNAIVSTTTVAVSGTPTTISVDQNAGKIVVAAQVGTTGTGSLAVIDGTTKQVEAVREFAVVPESMVFAPTGDRGLVVAKSASTLVDASYRTLATLPGGIGAAFAQGDDRIAILSPAATDAVVTFVGRAAPSALHLAGSARAITSLPDGGFLVLVELGGRSRVSYVAPDGHEAGSVDLAPAGRDLVYDAASRHFTVVGVTGVISGDVPQTLAAASPTPQPSPSAPSPSTSPASSPSAAPSPTGSPATVPSKAPTPNPLAHASPAGPSFVHIELPGGRQPILVSRSGEKLWVIDDRSGVDTVDMTTGAVFTITSLPRGAHPGVLAAGRDYVYALDTRTGQLDVVNRVRELVSSYSLQFLKPVSSVAVSVDDHLWIGLADAPYLLSFDPLTGRMASFDLAGAHISRLTIDALGRILYADDVRSTIGVYDPLRARISEVTFARHGSTTALVVDGRGSLWLATSAGEIYEIRDGTVRLALGLQSPITTLKVDGAGRVWYLAPMPAGTVGFLYGTAESGAATRVLPNPVASLDFNALGRAWLADPLGGFYVSQEVR